MTAYRRHGLPPCLLGCAVLAPVLAFGAPSHGGESATGAGPAPAAQPTRGTMARERRADDAVSPAEREFMMRAAATGLLEVRASRLAVVRSRSPIVQKLATRYVMDHTAANAELTRLANRWRVELPIAAPRAERRQLEELGKQQGADFDHAFIQVMGLDAHNDAIGRFEDVRPSVRQPELRAWLDRTLAVMRHHVQLARHAASGRSVD